MSWIKNQFNKLFKLDDEQDYEEYYEEWEEPQAASPKNQRQQDLLEEHQQGKKTFRFPLIEDDVDQSQQTERYEQRREKQTTGFYDEEKEKLSLPNYLQKSPSNEVYDVEVSGIRDLLERRRKGKGHSNVIRTPEAVRKVPVSREERKILTKNPQREDSNINKEFVNPLANRKRFVPTEVPSPIHGFLKPTPIEQLIEKQHKEQEDIELKETNSKEAEPFINTLDEVAATVTEVEQKPEQVQSIQMAKPVEEQQIEKEIIPLEQDEVAKMDVIELEVTEQELPVKEQLTTEVVQQPAILLEDEDEDEKELKEALPEHTVQEALNDVQVKHVTIENSTIHIGQLNVEQLPQQEPETIEQQLSPASEQQKSGSRLPFNVLMLKSDKQKLKTRQFVEQQLQLQKQKAAKKAQQPIRPFIEAQEEVHVTQEETPVTEQADDEDLLEERQESTTQAHLNAVPQTMPATEIFEERAKEQPQHEIPELKGQIVAQPIMIENQAPVGPTSNGPELVADSASIQAPVGLLEREQEELPPTQEAQKSMHIIEVEPLDEEEVKEVPYVEENANPIEPAYEMAMVEETPQLEEPKKPKRIPYVKPPLEYLVPPEEMVEDREWMDEQGENLVEALSYFQIQANIESIVQGPAVTQFEITVGQGTKVSKVRNLADDIKLALAAKDIRIDAPIPGKRSIGIEIPNRISRSVRLSEVTDSESFRNSDSPLEAALGLDLTGKPVTIDLRKMPHGLIAGATGSGKSVCINSILVSLLYKANPNELKLMLIDPKMVELAPFNHIPHLVSPVITDVKAATAALKWAVEEMERRYQLFMHSGARKIEAYNKMCDENGMYAQKLPYLLIVIDELADLMMMSPQDVEDSIVRITQKARAAGIHLIVATQRPSVDVITGLIKSNIPTRIAFSVSSQIDSRTILDAQGAERLLGRGDMLYLGNGMSAPTRIQGTFVTDDEIEEIIEYVREQGEPEYIFKQEELLKRAEAVEEQDELFEEVCRFVYEQGSASTSLLQRRYHIGYNRAARLIDMLERQGYVSEPKGSKPRDVYITEEDLAIQFGE